MSSVRVARPASHFCTTLPQPGANQHYFFARAMSDISEHTPSLQTPYRVLARKYRPQTFEDLIGQEAMVRTLTNAFASGRIAQAYMLTGVRGIGKTTTARLIARALNYAGEGEDNGPSVDLSGKGRHCEAILESRHVDVIEMDAASHTGVDNVREINDAVKYKPASARYKVYIIDEVHMLSTPAFNALLKTLEEPPPHVKFIFATTEIRKVPVTVLSRCQRFDLRRLDADLLTGHLERIAGLEDVKVETEALRMIARAAEGSVRDALSLLDQAIAYGSNQVLAADVQAMLGLSDRTRIIDLFDAVMRGDAAAAIEELEAQHALGADPEVILTDLASFVHWVTKLKVSQHATRAAAVTEQERTRGEEFAGKLAMPVLARAWQMLLKGIDEVSRSGNALMAAEMLLIRLAYVADLPTPEKLARMADGAKDASPARGQAEPAPAPAGSVTQPSSVLAPVLDAGQTTGSGQTSAQAKAIAIPDEIADDSSAIGSSPPFAATGFANFEELVEFVAQKRDVMLARTLERHVLPISMADGRLELHLLPDAPATIANDLSRRLEAWTGKRWIVSVSSNKGAGQSLAEQRRERRDGVLREVRKHPQVQAILEGFPGAEIVEVRDLSALASEQPPDGEDDNGSSVD